MDFSEYNSEIVAIAANNLGYFKSVNLNEDGTLEWYGEGTHPSDEDMMATMPVAKAQYDESGAINI